MIHNNEFKNNSFNRNLHWIISDSCNYNCSYCFIKNKRDYPVSPLLIAEALRGKLKGRWNFCISGGEPFIQPNFIALIKKIINFQQLDSLEVQTNFSSEVKEIVEFLNLTKNKLSFFFASLHLEYLSPEDFLKKASLIEKQFPGFKKKLLVSLPTLAEDFYLLEKIKKKFFDNDIQLLIRPQRLINFKFAEYSETQKKFLKDLALKFNLPDRERLALLYGTFGLNDSHYDNHLKFKGKRCSAGSLFLTINPFGEVYGCSLARRYKNKKLFLGNIITDHFELKKNFIKCPFETNCSPFVLRFFLS